MDLDGDATSDFLSSYADACAQAGVEVTSEPVANLPLASLTGDDAAERWHDDGMNAQLDPVVAALAGLDDAELHAMIGMVDDGPQLAPSLFGWIEHVCDWELNRRDGLDFPLRPPEDAIGPGEIPTSIVALTVIRGVFARDSSSASQAAAVLLDAILGVPTGNGRRM